MVEDGRSFNEKLKALDDLTPQQLAAPFEDEFQHFEQITIFSPYAIYDRPTKQLKNTTTQHRSTPEHYSSDSVVIAPKAGSVSKKASNRNPKSVCTLEHMMAERKRREKVTTMFIALSSLVPGLKKTDKLSVLEGSTEYIKQLAEKVKILEEQALEMTIESVISASINEDVNGVSPPEIEARSSGKNVLVRFQCKNHNDILTKMLMEIGKHNLTVLSCCSMPFGRFFDITILAEKEDEFNMAMVDLVKFLRSAFVN
ncbi:hypothetical protein ACHQM5_001078 [Ranunculus cassubicifolius]